MRGLPSPLLSPHQRARGPHGYVAAVRTVALEIECVILEPGRARARLHVVDLLLLDRPGPSVVVDVLKVLAVPREDVAVLASAGDSDLIVPVLEVLGESLSRDGLVRGLAVEASRQPVVPCSHLFLIH